MKKSLLNFSVILLLLVGSSYLNFASLSTVKYKNCRIPFNSSCITTTINNNESIIHIVIMGTSQGEGKLEFKNAKNEIVYSQTIKTWNERTDLDIEQTALLADDYTVSFTSVSMKCDAEFSFK